VIFVQPPWVKEDVYYRRTCEKLTVMLLLFEKTQYLWKGIIKKADGKEET